jgi:2-polyprenyl-3-methyl-5-hydroxy-6-metoxy-1,4-benzoquinol methylase/glycosyltransferase involved in cell wall biosynthesis
MTYDFDYGPDTPYGRAVALLERHRNLAGDVVIDLGCGYGAISEPVRSLGLSYLGVDYDSTSVKAVIDRGSEAIVGDLSRPSELLTEVDQALDQRSVAAICMLDVVEHLVNAEEVLEAVRDFAMARGAVPLIVSIPNVTHLDLAVKLLMGHWDVTPTGLLDKTHVRFFSDHQLAITMHGAGWHQIDWNDFELPVSDQCFPADAVPLQRNTVVGAFLDRVRGISGYGAFVNQFVRAYLPVRSGSPVDNPEMGTASPFLSVLVRTQGKRPGTLQETLLGLAAQTCEDFEVLLMLHEVESDVLQGVRHLVEEFHPSFSERVRMIEVQGGGRSRPLNVGARIARGQYIAMLDDDDMVFGHWVNEFRAAAQRAPGRVLRIGVAVQKVLGGRAIWDGQDGYEVRSRPYSPYPLRFDYIEHLYENWTPNNGYAVPRSVVTDLNQLWDESLPVLEDWDFLLRTAALCGVESCPTLGALVRGWIDTENSLTVHPPEEWDEARRYVIANLDREPLLMDRGTITRIRDIVEAEHKAHQARFHLERENLQLRAEFESSRLALQGSLEGAEARLREVLQSTSWRMTSLFRWASGLVRRGNNPGEVT